MACAKDEQRTGEPPTCTVTRLEADVEADDKKDCCENVAVCEKDRQTDVQIINTVPSAAADQLKTEREKEEKESYTIIVRSRRKRK